MAAAMNAMRRDFAAPRPARCAAADYLRMVDAGVFAEPLAPHTDAVIVIAPASR
jgi:hypothetical protein